MDLPYFPVLAVFVIQQELAGKIIISHLGDTYNISSERIEASCYNKKMQFFILNSEMYNT